MLERVILAITILYLICLAAEAFLEARHRRIFQHVVYVNGTRGKSSVCRLIDAGLRAGGLRVYTKTTGTLPMVINTWGEEQLIRRWGRANIREQLWVLRRAAREGAECLVVECMAVNPELQYISQHKMVRADIGVITNARPDHLDVMGNTVEEVGEALCNTVPKGGHCFTADPAFYPALAQCCERLGTAPHLTLPKGDEPDFDFDENIALALAVCVQLGADREAALKGMSQYRRDPYALTIHTLACGALFINGFSINDPVSTERVYRLLEQKLKLTEKRLVLLINNRLDRGYRTLQHRQLALRLNPSSVWVLGGNRLAATRFLRANLPGCNVAAFACSALIPLEKLTEKDVVFAAGNIAGQGKALMERLEKEGTLYV